MCLARALRRSGGSLLLVLLVAALASCSASDPATPVQDPVGNTYLRATFTMLDTGTPCAIVCDPEMFTCRGRAAILSGQTWTMRATTVTAGTASSTGQQFTITGTDTARLTSLALEFGMTSYAVGAPTAVFVTPSGTTSSASTWADIDTECDQVRSSGPESRFHLVRADTDSSVTLIQANVDGTALNPAIPDGQGGYSPAGIIEGTFSFIGTVIQATPTGALTGEVLVEGCFRVNLPYPERGVPVTASPAAPACS